MPHPPEWTPGMLCQERVWRSGHACEQATALLDNVNMHGIGDGSKSGAAIEPQQWCA
jgi:hypothetical protein